MIDKEWIGHRQPPTGDGDVTEYPIADASIQRIREGTSELMEDLITRKLGA